MVFMEWSAKLETGIGMIDAQHKMLVDLINTLESALRGPNAAKAAELVLVDLKKYTIYHFSAEETLMVRSGYAGLKEHQGQHQQFVEELEGFEIDALTDAPDLAQEILTFLKDWLVEHILGRDMEFANSYPKDLKT